MTYKEYFLRRYFMAEYREGEITGYPAKLKLMLEFDLRAEGKNWEEKKKLMIEMGMETEATLAKWGDTDCSPSGSHTV